MKLTTKQIRKMIHEELNKLLNEADEIIHNSNNLIIFSDWAQGHILRGHKEPGLGSIFKEVNMDMIMRAVESASLEGSGGVYTVEAEGAIGYDLVLPMGEAMALPDAKRVVVQKEERSGTVDVVGIQTSANIEDFATNKLSVVIRPSVMKYVPQPLQSNEEVIKAEAEGRLYGVLSSWPGRGDVPRASEWGENWAVIIPS